MTKVGKWKYNQTLSRVFSAQWWGCPSISFFHNLPREERLQIIAAHEAHETMTAINQFDVYEEAKQNAPKVRKSPKPIPRRRRKR